MLATRSRSEPVDSVRAQQREGRYTAIAGYLGVVGAGLMFGLAGLGNLGDPFALTLAALAFIAVAILLRPANGVYLAAFFTVVGDASTMDWYPFSANFSSGQSILYIHDQLTFSPLEVCIALTAAGWFAHAAGARDWRVVGGPLLRPMLVFAALIGVGLVYGMGTGGDQTAAFWEFRPLVYLVAIYLLTANLFTRTAQYVRLAWVLVAAITLQSLFALKYYYYDLAAGERSDLEALTDHPASLVYAWVLLLVLCLWVLRGGSLWARVLVTLAAVPTTWVFILSQRRAAMVGLVGGFLVFSVVLFFRRRKAFMVVVPIAFVLTAGYTAAFWNATEGVGFGAQAIKTVIAPGAVSEKDQSSDLYRDIENFDLSYTVKATPLLGVGFGKPFYRPIPLPDISFFIFYEYIPHNSILWIWLKMGFAGFVSLLYLFATAVRAGTRAALRMPDGNALAVTVAAFASIVMFVIFAYVDIAWISASAVFLGIGMATVGNILRVSGLDESQVRPVPTDEDTTGPRRLSQARRSLITQG